MFALTTMFVSDIERSLAFYRDLLGLPLLEETQAGPNRIAFLGREGDVRLELIQGAVPPAPSESLSVGVVPADLPRALDACTGSAEGPLSPAPGITFWFVRDPDGYRVQLLNKA